MQWSADNPVKTMFQDFLEKHPNADIKEDGPCAYVQRLAGMHISVNFRLIMK